MTTDIVPINLIPGIETTKEEMAAFTAIAGSAGFLQRFQLYTGKSEMVTKGTILPNHYGIPQGDKITDLGERVSVIATDFRPKALRIAGDDIFTFFKPDSAEFKDIAAQSSDNGSGCMYGPEFLCWLPDRNQFLTFFFGSKSSRNEAPNALQLRGKHATYTWRVASNKKFTWVCPSVIPNSVAPAALPDPELTANVREKFLNPVDSLVEKADEAVVAGSEERPR